MVDGYLKNLLFFDIPLLYYYINLSSSIIFCLFSGERHIFFGISLSSLIYSGSFVTVSELFCGEVTETFVILLSIFAANQITT